MKLTGYIIEKYSRMTEAYTCNRLIEEAKKQGVDLRVAGVYDSYVTKSGIGNSTMDGLFERRSFCINRYKWRNLKHEIALLTDRQYNNQEAFEVYINKFEQVKSLHSEGFIVPDYMLGTLSLPFELISDVLGCPFVAKGLESSMGQEIFLVSGANEYEELKARYEANKEWLFEEYISSSYGRDMRFYSIRGEAVACMTRRSQGDFRANVALGASVEQYPITDDIRQAAKDIYEQTGLDFLGIDLLFGKDKPYFCEINVMPGLEGIEKASGVNIAARIIETIRSDFL